MKWEPREYQRDAHAHMLAHPFSALFLDMGLGKTVITLSAIADLIDTGDVRAALIVAPLRVCQLVWAQEANKWSHTRGLTVAHVHGLPSRRRLALTPGADLYLINYENLIWLTEWLTHNKQAPFDMVVFDESSKMKSPTAKRFRRLKPLLNRFHRGAILTGTPAPKAYLDLWSQFYLLDRGRRLEPFVTHFRDSYFYPTDREGWTWALRPGADKRIEAKIADITLSLSAAEHLDLPPVIVNRVELPLAPALMAKYAELEKHLFTTLDTMDVEAFNAAALSNKCLQFTAGVVYAPSELDPTTGKPLGPQRFESIHTTKVDAAAEIVEDAQGQSVLVAYWYKSELAMLRKRFPSAPVLDGATSEADAVELCKAWNAGDVPVLLVHPASAGHGLNLQDGGHIIVYTTLPWSLEIYLQLIARLHRSGQKHPVVVHHLICPKTTDEAVELDKTTKDATQRGLLAALREYRRKRAKSGIAQS